MIHIVINEATCGTNELVRKFNHHRARGKERDRWHYLVLEAAGKVYDQTINCCEITVTRVGHNLLDWDNMGGGLKFLLDALVSTKIIKDDRPSVVHRLHLEQRCDRKGPPHTIIEIVPLEGC